MVRESAGKAPSPRTPVRAHGHQPVPKTSIRSPTFFWGDERLLQTLFQVPPPGKVEKNECVQSQCKQKQNCTETENRNPKKAKTASNAQHGQVPSRKNRRHKQRFTTLYQHAGWRPPSLSRNQREVSHRPPATARRQLVKHQERPWNLLGPPPLVVATCAHKEGVPCLQRPCTSVPRCKGNRIPSRSGLAVRGHANAAGRAHIKGAIKISRRVP